MQFYKLGLEMMMSGGYFELLDWMVARGKKVFADLKFFDVPATVGAAVRQLSPRGVTFATVHGNQGIMEAAAKAKGEVKILAVTVLTSLDRGDLDDLGFACDVERLVLSRARRAFEAGCDGVVASGLELPACARRSTTACWWLRPVSGPWTTGQWTTRSVSSPWSRRFATARTILSSAARSATPRIPGRPPRRSRQRLPAFSRRNDSLL